MGCAARVLAGVKVKDTEEAKNNSNSYTGVFNLGGLIPDIKVLGVESK